jgi:hypothetical protein
MTSRRQHGSNSDAAPASAAVRENAALRTARILREERRAAWSDLIGQTLRDGSITQAAAAEMLGMSETAIAECCKAEKPRALALADAAGLPTAQRHKLAAELAGPTMALAPVGDAESPHARMHAVLSELSDVTRAALTAEADGYISPAEAADEIREIEEAERSLADRKAHLRRVIEARGMRVAGGAR